MLRDVAGDVDPNEMERHAFAAGPLVGREPVADLLEARAEAMAEELDVVPEGTGALEEGLVRHEQGPREIVRKGHARQRKGARRRQAAAGKDLLEGRTERQDTDLGC